MDSTPSPGKQINLEDLMSCFLFWFFAPDRIPEELLQISPPRDSEAVQCVQQRADS